MGSLLMKPHLQNVSNLQILAFPSLHLVKVLRTVHTAIHTCNIVLHLRQALFVKS